MLKKQGHGSSVNAGMIGLIVSHFYWYLPQPSQNSIHQRPPFIPTPTPLPLTTNTTTHHFLEGGVS